MAKSRKRKRGASQLRFVDCDVCGETFTTKRSHTSTCGPKCRKAKQRLLEGGHYFEPASSETDKVEPAARTEVRRNLNRRNVVEAKRPIDRGEIRGRIKRRSVR